MPALVSASGVLAHWQKVLGTDGGPGSMPIFCKQSLRPELGVWIACNGHLITRPVIVGLNVALCIEQVRAAGQKISCRGVEAVR